MALRANRLVQFVDSDKEVFFVGYGARLFRTAKKDHLMCVSDARRVCKLSFNKPIGKCTFRILSAEEATIALLMSE